MTDYFNLAKTICVEPYMRIEDEWDREKRWWDERDDAMYGDEDEDEYEDEIEDVT